MRSSPGFPGGTERDRLQFIGSGVGLRDDFGIQSLADGFGGHFERESCDGNASHGL